MADKFIAAIKKDKSDEVRVSPSADDDHDLANVRAWRWGEDGTLKPSGAGMKVPLDELPDVMIALLQHAMRRKRDAKDS